MHSTIALVASAWNDKIGYDTEDTCLRVYARMT
jgi:hypothetical protein